VSKFEKRRVKAFAEEFEEYLRLKREKFNNQGQSSSAPSASTSCTVEGQGPWILDSGAFDHIFYSRSSFSLISSPKIPHHVTITNGFKVASQAIVQVSLSPLLNLNLVLYIAHCPYNLIYLSQLLHSLNCIVTFDANSFVI